MPVAEKYCEDNGMQFKIITEKDLVNIKDRN